jgi:hypothetical protein
MTTRPARSISLFPPTFELCRHVTSSPHPGPAVSATANPSAQWISTSLICVMTDFRRFQASATKPTLTSKSPTNLSSLVQGMGSQAAAVGMALVGLLVGAGYGFKVSHGLRLSTQVGPARLTRFHPNLAIFPLVAAHRPTPRCSSSLTDCRTPALLRRLFFARCVGDGDQDP